MDLSTIAIVSVCVFAAVGLYEYISEKNSSNEEE